MTHAQFLRIKKLRGKAIIEVAARHNHREILAELGGGAGGHIDPARVSLNRVLRGPNTAAAVARQAQALMDDAGVKTIRKDAVRALEIIFSLSVESAIDRDCFFDKSVQWVGEYFKAPVISAIVHNDEAAPHCHVLVLPLIDGRMIGSDLMGGRAELQALHTDFYSKVGQRFGLTRQAAQVRSSAAIRKLAIDAAFNLLKENGALSDDVLRALLLPHMNDPAPLLMALGLKMPTSKGSTTGFVKIMTKACKPDKPIGFGKKKPIGFDESASPEKPQTLCSVGFGKPLQNSPPDETPISNGQSHEAAPVDTPTVKVRSDELAEQDRVHALEERCTRERDSEQSAKYWDEVTGGFIKQVEKASRKSQVLTSVRAALDSLERNRRTLPAH